MDIGFIGLGNMGFPMARRLIEAGHALVVFDTRKEVVDKLAARGAKAATSPKDVADQVDTIMASLPSLKASLEVAPGASGVGGDGRRRGGRGREGGRGRVRERVGSGAERGRVGCAPNPRCRPGESQDPLPQRAVIARRRRSGSP